MERATPDPDPAGAARTMLVAQITDTHLGFRSGAEGDPNRARLERLVAAIGALDRTPDVVLITGDLVEHGDVASYRALREALAPLAMPVWPALGNHDLRAPFRAVFPEVPTDPDGFVHYVMAGGALRLVVLDTVAEGRHGGAFCAARAAWLAARLAEDRSTPTLIALHHPPVDSGIPWLTTDVTAPWVARLRGALAGAGNVVGLVAGHVHRPIVAGWEGFPVAVCPSAAPRVALALAPLDPDRPDGRAMIEESVPGLALHWWNGAALTTHFADAAAVPVLARFDDGLRAMVDGIMRERPA